MSKSLAVHLHHLRLSRDHHPDEQTIRFSAAARGLNPRCRPRRWFHPVHGEIVATTSEMTRKFPELRKGRLNPVALGQRRSYKGWTCEIVAPPFEFLFGWKML